MPGWHVSTKYPEEAGTINVMGIVLEQHPERARLFMQWQKMGWPVAVDALNLLELRAVPVTLLLAPDGRISQISPDPDRFLESLEKPEPLPPIQDSLNVWKPWIGDAEKHFLSGDGSYTPIISQLKTRLNSLPPQSAESALTYFRLGVVTKARDESSDSEINDFAEAVEFWQQALIRDPNQYIWRRRIQQYGPRLTKPYPFYDWVPQALDDLKIQGNPWNGGPISLTGSEVTTPSQNHHHPAAHPNPDPDNKINHLAPGSLNVSLTVIPKNFKPGDTVRVHVQFRLTQPQILQWNNEAEQAILHVPQSRWTPQALNLAWDSFPVDSANSSENRSFDFEIDLPESDSSRIESGDPVEIPVFLVSHYCNKLNGICYMARRNAPIHLGIPDDDIPHPAEE